jgi:predicted transcriptional regulator
MSIISLLLQVFSPDDKDTRRGTKITYNTLLNHHRPKEYGTALTEEGILAYDNANQTFKTTEKGIRFLDIFSKLDKISREEQQQQKEKEKDMKKNSKV